MKLEVRRVTTNTSGEYVAPLLPVGTYEIDVESSGFKRAAQKDVAVNVSDRLQENISLTVGESGTTVNVSSTQVQVQLQNAAGESLIDGEQVRALPTNNRNYKQLVAIQPGVSGNVPDQLYVGVYNYKNQTNVASFSIGGGRDSQNNWTIDGADNVDRGSNKTLLNYPSVDAIEEFKLLRGTYNAEYGCGAAGQIEVVTRSGGNEFHGGVYEFFRNDAMDANSFFNKRGGIGKTPLRYNDFGGTFGGARSSRPVPSREAAHLLLLLGRDSPHQDTGSAQRKCADHGDARRRVSIPCLHCRGCGGKLHSDLRDGYSLFNPPTDGKGILTNFAPSTYVAKNAPQLDANGLLVANTGAALNGIILGDKGSPYGNGVEGRTYTAFGPRVGVRYRPLSQRQDLHPSRLWHLPGRPPRRPLGSRRLPESAL